MLKGRIWRAASAVALISGIAIAGGSQAAHATPTATSYSAVASWVATASGGPNVALQVTGQSGPAGNFVFFFVSEGSCTPSGWLGYDYFYEGPGSIFVAAPNLSTAVLAPSAIQGTLTTTTSPYCDGTGLTSISSEAAVSAFGRWSATGPAQETFPGNIVRPAAATVELTGPALLGLSQLGAPSFAQISSYTAP